MNFISVTGAGADQASAAVLTLHWRVVQVLLRPVLCALGQAIVLLCDAQQLLLEIVGHNAIRLGPRLLCPIVPVLRVQKNERMLFDMTNSLVNIRSSTVWKSLAQCRLDHGRLPACYWSRRGVASASLPAPTVYILMGMAR